MHEGDAGRNSDHDDDGEREGGRDSDDEDKSGGDQGAGDGDGADHGDGGGAIAAIPFSTYDADASTGAGAGIGGTTTAATDAAATAAAVPGTPTVAIPSLRLPEHSDPAYPHTIGFLLSQDFSISAEYQRIGLTHGLESGGVGRRGRSDLKSLVGPKHPADQWRVSRLNQEFSLCHSYPPLLVVPRHPHITDEFLKVIVQTSPNRNPTSSPLAYINPPILSTYVYAHRTPAPLTHVTR